MRKIYVGAALAAGALLTAAVPGTSAGAPGTPETRGGAGERTRLGDCGAGRLCLWERPGFAGARQTFELSGMDVESCVPLPRGTGALSFANRTGRPVTVYQSRECAETGEFATHPSGSWTPEGAYQVRAVKVWER